MGGGGELKVKRLKFGGGGNCRQKRKEKTTWEQGERSRKRKVDIRRDK
jgi:hypothetical protein